MESAPQPSARSPAPPPLQKVKPWRVAGIIFAVVLIAIALLVASVGGLWYGVVRARRDIAFQGNEARRRYADDSKYMADASIESARGAMLDTPIFDLEEAMHALRNGDDINIYRVVEWMATTDPNDAGTIAEQQKLVFAVDAVGMKHGEELAELTARVAHAWRASIARAQQQDEAWHEARRAQRAANEATKAQRNLERLMKLEEEAVRAAAASNEPPFLNQREFLSATSAQRRANADRIVKEGRERVRRRQEEIRRRVAALPLAE